MKSTIDRDNQLWKTSLQLTFGENRNFLLNNIGKNYSAAKIQRKTRSSCEDDVVGKVRLKGWRILENTGYFDLPYSINEQNFKKVHMSFPKHYMKSTRIKLFVCHP